MKNASCIQCDRKVKIVPIGHILAFLESYGEGFNNANCSFVKPEYPVKTESILTGYRATDKLMMCDHCRIFFIVPENQTTMDIIIRKIEAYKLM